MTHLLTRTLHGLLSGGEDGLSRADTWQPAASVDLNDGEALHRVLYENGDFHHPRRWCAAATNVLTNNAMQSLERRLQGLSSGDVLRVCDYGTGTGLAAIELLKACRRSDLEQKLAHQGVRLELYLLDIPSDWFAYGYGILSSSSWTRFHSLTTADGRFRPLLDVTGGARMDVILSSMVFHLVPPKALPRLSAGLAEISEPGAELFWSTPDLGPEEADAVLVHNPNRATRARWRTLVTGGADPSSATQRSAVAAARRDRSGGTLLDDLRADRRILPIANLRKEIDEALAAHFLGETDTEKHEITDREAIDTLLVPSNQREYFPEIEDENLRSELIRELMLEDVLPKLRRGSAGTSSGFNMLWTYGRYARK